MAPDPPEHLSPAAAAELRRLLRSGIAPPAAAEIRALLNLAPDAEDQSVTTAVFNAVRLRDAALDIGFTRLFNEALLRGRATEADRAYWSERFYRDPDTTREDLAREWRSTG